LESLRFSSSDYTGSTAFEAYHALYSQGTQVTPVGTSFSATVAGTRFRRMLLFDRVLSGVSHERSPRRVAADGFDHVMLQLVLEGRLMVETDEVARIAEAGETVVFDLTRSQRTWVDQARIATVSIAREVVAKSLPPFTDLHGLVLPAVGSEILTDFIRSLIRNGAAIEETMAEAVTATVGALLGATLGGSGAAPLLEAAKLNQILDFIEGHLALADLTAETIAARMGVSRSALYRMFEPLGGVSACVQQRRLLALRRALARTDDQRPFRAIAAACGFASDSHANRSFREAFGQTPGEFRQGCREYAGQASVIESPGREEFARWFTEVR
jgi:AraC-like DNA-binding protein